MIIMRTIIITINNNFDNCIRGKKNNDDDNIDTVWIKHFKQIYDKKRLIDGLLNIQNFVGKSSVVQQKQEKAIYLINVLYFLYFIWFWKPVHYLPLKHTNHLFHFWKFVTKGGRRDERGLAAQRLLWGRGACAAEAAQAGGDVAFKSRYGCGRRYIKAVRRKKVFPLWLTLSFRWVDRARVKEGWMNHTNFVKLK